MTFNGHFFAKAFKFISSYEAKIASVITKDIEPTEIAADTVAASLDPAAVPLVDAGYAVLGELASVLTVGGEAAAAKLTDAGLDLKVITLVKGMIPKVQGVVAIAKTL